MDQWRRYKKCGRWKKSPNFWVVLLQEQLLIFFFSFFFFFKSNNQFLLVFHVFGFSQFSPIFSILACLFRFNRKSDYIELIGLDQGPIPDLTGRTGRSDPISKILFISKRDISCIEFWYDFSLVCKMLDYYLISLDLMNLIEFGLERFSRLHD